MPFAVPVSRELLAEPTGSVVRVAARLATGRPATARPATARPVVVAVSRLAVAARLVAAQRPVALVQRVCRPQPVDKPPFAVPKPPPGSRTRSAPSEQPGRHLWLACCLAHRTSPCH